VRTRAIVVSILVSIATLVIGSGAGGRSDPPARTERRAIRGPIVAVSPMTDFDAVAAADAELAAFYAEETRRIEEYLAWQHEQDVAAWIAAHPPAPPARATGGGGQATFMNPAPPMGSCNGDFDCFKPCTFAHESGGNYAIVSPGGTYRGAWQFDQGTWNNAVTNAGYGEWAGRPANEAPPEIQDAAARWLYSMRGNQPWGGRC